MIETSNYPVGAQYDDNAPYNEKDTNLPDRPIEVTISLTMSVNKIIWVNDYELKGTDEDGDPIYDYSNCNLKQAVLDQVWLPKDDEANFKDWTEDEFEVIKE